MTLNYSAKRLGVTPNDPPSQYDIICWAHDPPFFDLNFSLYTLGCRRRPNRALEYCRASLILDRVEQEEEYGSEKSMSIPKIRATCEVTT
jgi:hypothetical protein